MMRNEYFCFFGKMDAGEVFDKTFDFFGKNFFQHFASAFLFFLLRLGAVSAVFYFGVYSAGTSQLDKIGKSAILVIVLFVFLTALKNALDTLIIRNSLFARSPRDEKLDVACKNLFFVAPSVLSAVLAQILVIVPIAAIFVFVLISTVGGGNFILAFTSLIMRQQLSSQGKIALGGAIVILIFSFVVYQIFSLSVTCAVFERKKFFGALSQGLRFFAYKKDFIVFLLCKLLWGAFWLLLNAIIWFILSKMFISPTFSVNQWLYSALFAGIKLTVTLLVTSTLFSGVLPNLQTVFYLKFRSKRDGIDIASALRPPNRLLKITYSFPHYRVARNGSRFAAFLADISLLSTILTIFLIISKILFFSKVSVIISPAFIISVVFAALVLGVTYDAFCVSVFERTFGQKLFGLRVLRGGPALNHSVFLRSFLKYSADVIIAAPRLMFMKNSQSIADTICKTVVLGSKPIGERLFSDVSVELEDDSERLFLPPRERFALFEWCERRKTFDDEGDRLFKMFQVRFSAIFNVPSEKVTENMLKILYIVNQP